MPRRFSLMKLVNSIRSPFRISAASASMLWWFTVNVVALRFFALSKDQAPTPDNRTRPNIVVPMPAYTPVLRPADCEDASEVDATPAWENVNGVEAALVVEESIVDVGLLTKVDGADFALAEELDVDAELLTDIDGTDAAIVDDSANHDLNARF
ncbi:MAG: hypothetical protein M1830_000788 [Pleopsidium flavum]|nr:MAG: hypothetical protein M1830_000788 [Pleopsidium flavum]